MFVFILICLHLLILLVRQPDYLQCDQARWITMWLKSHLWVSWLPVTAAWHGRVAKAEITKGLHRQNKFIWRITQSAGTSCCLIKSFQKTHCECINADPFLRALCALNCRAVTLQSVLNPISSPILHCNPNSLNRGISAMFPALCSAFHLLSAEMFAS